MATSNASLTKWRRRKEARPGEIVDAALDAFTEKGFAATRIDEVAARAGVSKGTVYLYFDSKEELFKALVKEKVLPQMQKAEKLVLEHSGNKSDLLEKIARQWWDALQRTELAGMPKLIISEAGNFPDMARFYVETVVQRMRGLITNVIQAGIEAGEFRDTSAREAARVFSSVIVFAAIWQHSLAPYDSVPFESEKYFQIHLENFVRGLQK